MEAAIEALALQGRRAQRVLLTPRAVALLAVFLGLDPDAAEAFATNGELLGLEVLVIEGPDDRPLVLP